MASIWDNCLLDSEQENCVKIIKANTKFSVPSDAVKREAADGDMHEENSVGVDTNPMVIYSQKNLVATENSCKSFVQDLDGMISMLDNITTAHNDVTGRTNSLMRNCEDLLERQKSLQVTVDILQSTVEPFEKMEEVASLLGIPTDAYGKPIARKPNSHIDLRSAEFKNILAKISDAIIFLCEHTDIQDCVKYGRWLVTLQNRSSSLVSKEMRELLENAFKSCEDNLARQAVTNGSSAHVETPLESHVSYNKFRGLGKRMRDLLELLEYSLNTSASGTAEYALFTMLPVNQGGSNNSGSNAYWGGYSPSAAHETSDVALRDVFEMYYGLRSHLLKSLVESEHNHLETTSRKPSSGATFRFDLSHYVRQSFSLLLRIVHLEFHLFETLFLTKGKGGASSGERIAVAKGDGEKWVTAANKSNGKIENGGKVHGQAISEDENASLNTLVRWSTDPILKERVGAFVKITDDMCGKISGELRAKIIKESSVDALCRIISTLCDDMTAQIASLRLPTAALRRLETCLSSAVSDGLDRLAFCTEVTLREEVQCFEPLPSQVAYPSILTEIRASAKANGREDDESLLTLDSISNSWYPPMKSTLALLSKLYGVIDAGTFEEFASRVVPLCVKILRKGADKIRRGGGSCGGGPPALLHADLFLVRHLLILREQLTPFDTRFQSIERRLDFSPTGVAFGNMLKNTRSLFKMDSTNALMQFSQNGVPELKVRQVDVRRELDITLKEACRLLRCSAVTLMLGPLESFLAKVSAFAGIDIPTDLDSNDNESEANSVGLGQSETLLPSSVRATLKGQSFMKVDRVRTMLDSVMEVAVHKTPEMREMLQLYIDNNVSRAVLVKPIQVEVDLTKRRMVTVLLSCVDPGQAQRDLLQQLDSVIGVAGSELVLVTANGDNKAS